MPLTRGNFCPLNWSVGARFCKLICLAVFWFISLSHPSIYLSLSIHFFQSLRCRFLWNVLYASWKIKGKKKGCCCIIDPENLSFVNVCSKEKNRMKLNFHTPCSLIVSSLCTLITWHFWVSLLCFFLVLYSSVVIWTAWPPATVRQSS